MHKNGCTEKCRYYRSCLLCWPFAFILLSDFDAYFAFFFRVCCAPFFAYKFCCVVGAGDWGVSGERSGEGGRQGGGALLFLFAALRVLRVCVVN